MWYFHLVTWLTYLVYERANIKVTGTLASVRYTRVESKRTANAKLHAQEDLPKRKNERLGILESNTPPMHKLLIAVIVVRVGHEQPPGAHGHRAVIHAASPPQLVAGLAVVLHRASTLRQAAHVAKARFSFSTAAAVAAAALAAWLREVVGAHLAVLVGYRCFFFEQVAHASAGAVVLPAWWRGSVAVTAFLLALMAACSVATAQARAATAVALVESGGVLTGDILVAVLLVDLAGTQSHWYAGAAQTDGVVCARLWCTVMPYFASHTACDALTAGADSSATLGVVMSTGHLHCGTHLCLSLCS